MSIAVRYTAKALLDIAEKDSWWRENRDAQDLFDEELHRIIALLQERPEIGAPYKHRIKGIRKLRVRKTPYLLFYRYDAKEQVIVLMTVASGMTKGKPKLE